MATNYNNFFEKDYQKLTEKYEKTSEKLKQIKYEYQLLQARNKTLLKQLEISIQEAENVASNKFQSIIDEKDKELEKANQEIARLKSLLNLDGTNSGLPTSKTPIDKKKVIPNTRVKTGKSVGGQFNHPKHKLKKFKDEEINDNVEHTLEACPYCNGELKIIGEKCKDELSYRFVTIKRRHHFIQYECKCCHKEVHPEIPVRLKEENQYGSEIQAVALSLANEGNVPMNKIKRIIKGISHNEIDMSEGYIAKLQKRGSNKLQTFKHELYLYLLKQKLINWDDSVIIVNGKQACLRFYGTPYLAYYVAHLSKNKEGILDDGILNSLSKETIVMHDHNKVNYNKNDFSYTNAECNVHLLRDIEKCKMNTNHKWCEKMRELIQKAIHDRKENAEQESFSVGYIESFDNELNEIVLFGIEENKNDRKNHYNKKEMTLLNRILEYKVNYFMWMHDFDIPVDNNLSERGLRGAKSKMKAAGQFKNISYAEYYANVRTYIETCYRNGINPTDALIRLMEDNPYSLEEILAIKKENDEKSN